MASAPYNRVWENWAPVVARLFLAIQFGLAAFFKIVAFAPQVAETGALGVPFPNIAVGLALILEIIAVISLLSGWQIRRVSAVLVFYVALLAVLFYHNWSDQMAFGAFVSHMGLIAALLYVSTYGAQHLSVNKN